ncbi:MAG: DedA family protein [Pseudomonadota bacterium]|nr:DedA family protein [Pseudomonadota bacterium]
MLFRSLRSLYDWVLTWAHSPYALPALAVVAFAESSFFLIPPDVLLIPMVLSKRHKYLAFASTATLASVLGGLAGYLLGYFAWQTLGVWLVEHVMRVELIEVAGRLDIALPAYIANFLALESPYLFQAFAQYNAWVVFVFALTPLPYKLITISAGFAQVNILVFMLASLAARGARFFAVALIMHRYGATAQTFIDKYFNLLTIAFIVLLVLGLLLVKAV